MTQFSDTRGARPDLTEQTVLLDTRKPEMVEDNYGTARSQIVGDLIVLVTPVGNNTKASIYVNDRAVANAWEVDKAKKAGKTVVKMFKDGKSVEEIEAAINK